MPIAGSSDRSRSELNAGGGGSASTSSSEITSWTPSSVPREEPSRLPRLPRCSREPTLNRRGLIASRPRPDVVIRPRSMFHAHCAIVCEAGVEVGAALAAQETAALDGPMTGVSAARSCAGRCEFASDREWSGAAVVCNNCGSSLEACGCRGRVE